MPMGIKNVCIHAYTSLMLEGGKTVINLKFHMRSILHHSVNT